MIDLVHREQAIPSDLRARITTLLDQGIIESVGRGRGTRYMLSREFYVFLGQKGAYTRKRGLDHETNKALLVKHIRDNRTEGSRLQELMQVLPSLSRKQVQSLLKSLKKEGRVRMVGLTNGSRWYPGA